MVTVKSYTDFEQSKKLAEILPIESADMYRVFENNSETRVYYGKISTAYFVCKPCWSLSALFNVIPKEIFNGEYVINITEGRDNKWILTYEYYRNRSYYEFSTGSESLVDACYEMIIELHGRNLL